MRQGGRLPSLVALVEKGRLFVEDRTRKWESAARHRGRAKAVVAAVAVVIGVRTLGDISARTDELTTAIGLCAVVVVLALAALLVARVRTAFALRVSDIGLDAVARRFATEAAGSGRPLRIIAITPDGRGEAAYGKRRPRICWLTPTRSCFWRSLSSTARSRRPS
jgi:hypothetical protein